MQLSIRRRFAAGAIAFGIAASALIGTSQVTAAAPASAAACTDGGSTLANFTAYNQYVELRASGNCGGAVWFRINNNGGPIQGSGDVTLQAKTRSGTIVNLKTYSTYAAGQSWVSPYYTGYKSARLVYKNTAGGLGNSSTAWKALYQNAR